MATGWPDCLDRIWRQLEQRQGKSGGTREMIGLVREGTVAGWPRLIAAVMNIMCVPDAEERQRYAIALAEELQQFERPMPTLREYDLLLTGSQGRIQ